MKAVSEVVLVENADVLLEGNAQAVEHVVNVGLREERGVSELSLVGCEVVVVLNGLDDVPELKGLQGLLGHNSVEIVHWDQEMVQVACVLLQGSWVTEGALVVGDGPLWGAHNTEVVVEIRVQGAKKSILSSKTTGSHYNNNH